MVENLVQAFLMVEWFRLSVSLDLNWLEIVHCAVFMADGIPVFQYAKVRRLFWGSIKMEVLICNLSATSFHDSRI